MKSTQTASQPQRRDFTSLLSPPKTELNPLVTLLRVLSLGLVLMLAAGCGEEPDTWTDDDTASDELFAEDKDVETITDADVDADVDVDVDTDVDSNSDFKTDLDTITTPEDTSGPTDECPLDPDKTAPGICGCGVPDADDDKDGSANCEDECPLDPQKTQEGECGCFVREGTCGKDPYIEPTKKTYFVGEPVVVQFFNLTKDKKNWIGLFNFTADNKTPIVWLYTDGKKDGSMVFGGLAPGHYDARLFLKDSFELKDKVPFKVKLP